MTVLIEENKCSHMARAGGVVERLGPNSPSATDPSDHGSVETTSPPTRHAQNLAALNAPRLAAHPNVYTQTHAREGKERRDEPNE